jgi:hypothetical protein
MALRTSRWANESVGVERGPLAFSLRMDENWRQRRDFFEDFEEYEVLPASAWNVALALDPDDPTAGLEVTESSLDGQPFDPEQPPLTLSASGSRLPSWELTDAKGGGGVFVGSMYDGNWHPIESASANVPAGEANRLTVRAQGSTIDIFLGEADAPVLTVEDGRHTSGSVGLRTFDSAATFANATVQIDGGEDRSIDEWEHYGGNWTAGGEGSDTAAVSVDAIKGGKAVVPDLNASSITFSVDVTAEQAGNAGVILRVSDPAAQNNGFTGYYIGLNAAEQGVDVKAAEPPESVDSSAVETDTEDLTLIPYGAGHLRVSYFPILEDE